MCQTLIIRCGKRRFWCEEKLNAAHAKVLQECLWHAKIKHIIKEARKMGARFMHAIRNSRHVKSEEIKKLQGEIK